MKHKYVVAGTHQQATRWVSEQEPVRDLRYIYVSYPEMLKGMIFGPEDVVYVGSYWENPHFQAITRELNHVHSKAERLNGK